MNYEEAINYIHDTLKFGIKPGLETISNLMEFMGNPQKSLRYVHVAGTNGKGSTASFISSVLMCAGYKTGLFTSPYIQRFTERIKINDQEISSDDLTDIIEFVKGKIDLMQKEGFPHPTEFEIITAIAFEYFYRNNCDIVVLEVGLGGRYDSTNIIEKPEVCVITTISLDHTDRLGKTIEEIAYQKAGIIKSNCDTIIYPQKPEVEQVFEQVANDMKALLHKTDLTDLTLKQSSLEGQIFDYREYKDIMISLLGEHQIRKAAVAIRACEILANKGFDKISINTIKNGLKQTKWQGRFEVINKKPLVVIDGAHNFEGGQALSEAIDKNFSDKKKIFIVGFLRDKEYLKIMELLASKAELIIAVTPDNERAIASNELTDVLKKYSNNVIDGETIENAVKIALTNSDDDSVVIAFGSLYMIGEIRKIYK